jgi:copper transport protein
VVLVAAAGLTLAWAEVRSWEALFGAAYGWVLLAKLGLVGLVLVVGAYNNRVLVPAIRRGTSQAWRRLSQTVRVEAAGLVVVLAVTAFLVAMLPARVSVEAAGMAEHGAHTGDDTHSGHHGPHEDDLALGPDLRAHLVVDPATVGTNTVTVRLREPEGAPFGDAEDVELRLSLPESDIAGLTRSPEEVGPGHYRHTGAEFAPQGHWEIEIRVMVSDFERLTATAHVPIGAG